MTTPWPDSFDFETDETCQRVFKPFIEKELALLKEYDAQRPQDITYIFHEHAERVAHNVRKTCLHMGLSEKVANNMYWALLPHDIGKRRLPAIIWDQEEKPDEHLKKLRRAHTELGVQIVTQELGVVDHPFMALMLDIMMNHHEQMDGKGYHGIEGKDLSKPVRLAAIIEGFDGWSIRRPHFGGRDVSVTGVLERMRSEKGADMFDMELFEAFAEMKAAEYKEKMAKKGNA
jgi:HD-GYP domain-containing protein (c-di-GMP phosphodiesterase class II)